MKAPSRGRLALQLFRTTARGTLLERYTMTETKKITCPYCGNHMSLEHKEWVREKHLYYMCGHCGARSSNVIYYKDSSLEDAAKLCNKLASERVD